MKKRLLSILLVLSLMLALVPAAFAAGDVSAELGSDGTTLTFSGRGTATADCWDGDWTAVTHIALGFNISGIAEDVLARCVNLVSFETIKGSWYLRTYNGGLISEDSKQMLAAPNKCTAYEIPDLVNTVKTGAFRYCQGLTAVTFPASLTTIEAQAFTSCLSLTAATLPDGLKTIGDFAFAGCAALTSVLIPKSVTSIGADGTEQMELVVGERTKMFPAGGILCKRSGFGDYENQYFWQSKVFDGKLFLGTFDTSSLLEPLGQFTNGDLLHMSRDEWASQIGYLKVLLKLLLDKNKNNGDGTLFAAGSGDAAAAIDAAVDAVNAESPELFTMTDTQYDTMRQALKDGVYDAPYSANTLRRLNELNALLGELTDLVETNDISGFVARYQKANDLYASLSGKLPDALKKLYETLVRITELENMKDLCICLKKLSTATRGFGLYTITSDNGKLTLETLTRDGFGDPYNHGLRAFAANDEQGWMVIGTANPFMGTQLWRTTVNTPDPMERFTDLNPFNWAYPGIRYCVTNGLMSGTSDTTFAPDAVMTRAQIVQVLYNLAGEPAVAGTTPFTDLTSDWYQDAVLWAYRTGVVAGTSDTTFDPDAPVTREQIAVILMGYADMVQHRDHTWPPADLSAFPDGADVSDWARDAVAEAVALGILNGAEINGELRLLPQGQATRAQVATLLEGFCKIPA